MSSSTTTFVGTDGVTSTSVVSLPSSSTLNPSTSSSSSSSSPTSVTPSSSSVPPTSTTPSSTPTPSSTHTTTSSTSSATPTSTSTLTPTTLPTSTSTALITSTSTVSSQNTPVSTQIVVITSTPSTTDGRSTSHSTTASSTASSGASLNTNTADSKNGSSGLSSGGVTAIAVVVPVVVVALLVLAALFLWRKRKQKKNAEDARRKEVEEYGFNPNNDPTLPTVASEAGGAEMAEDHSGGYRGWGAATASSRKMSTTLSGGHTPGQPSDASAALYAPVAGSPHNGHGSNSDAQSDNPLMGGYNGNSNRDTMDSDEIGNLAAFPAASSQHYNSNNLPRRGPSNASSRYSHGALSDTSDPPVPPMPGQGYENYGVANGHPGGFGYTQHGPYGDGSYGGAAGPDAAGNGMPVVRDVSARRNTRIQQPGNYSQGNSGIAQNF